MNLSIFCVFCCHCNGADTRKVFHRLAFKFFLFFSSFFSHSQWGNKKRFFAKTVKLYQELKLGFFMQTVKKRSSEITRKPFTVLIVKIVLLFLIFVIFLIFLIFLTLRAARTHPITLAHVFQTAGVSTA